MSDIKCPHHKTNVLITKKREASQILEIREKIGLLAMCDIDQMLISTKDRILN